MLTGDDTADPHTHAIIADAQQRRQHLVSRADARPAMITASDANSRSAGERSRRLMPSSTSASRERHRPFARSACCPDERRFCVLSAVSDDVLSATVR